MTEIVPTKGRIVWYVLSADDATAINKRRHDANQHMAFHRNNANGVMVHVGNEAKEGAIYPAMVVETWGDKPDSRVNLKVELDGSDNFWATSRQVGEGPGTYHWMPYQKGQAAKHDALEKKVAAAGLVLAIAVIAGLLCSPSAHAADLYTKAPAPAAAPLVGSWSGAYFGAFGGYGYAPTGPAVDVQSFAADIGGAPHGPVIGAQIGYDYEIANKLVIGASLSASLANMTGSGALTGALTGAPVTLQNATNYMGCLCARVGTTAFADHVLLAVEGGFGFGGAKPNFQVGSLQAAAADTSTGYAIGPDLVVKLNRNWELEGKVLYYRLGDKSLSFTDSTGALIATSTTPYNFAVATVGVNYRFSY